MFFLFLIFILDSTVIHSTTRKTRAYTYTNLGCRIHRLFLCKGVRPPQTIPGYNTKQSDNDVPVMLELWGMPSRPSSLWPGVVAPDRALSIGLIELNCVLMLNWIVWNVTPLAFNFMETKNYSFTKLNCLN